jgi:uncharacterized circularly permuted ATP-grasp superfamily protein/uncharacterized alpha-E superfamily protein
VSVTSNPADSIGTASTVDPVGDILSRYADTRTSLFHPEVPRLDELLADDGRLRPAWAQTSAVLRLLDHRGLAERQAAVARILADDGVTYRPRGATDDQPWALDPIPFVVDEQQWAGLEPALRQRAALLDLILTDLYGPRKLISRGLLPPEVVFAHPGFIREVDQLRLPGSHQLTLCSTDLARDTDGRWLALSDRTQAPSGAGYAMENRRVVARAMPVLYRSSQLYRLGPFFDSLRVALQQLGPDASEAPRVVLLTSGAGSETAFDQAFLSLLLGFPLVAGSDLVVEDGRVWQRSIGRQAAVDVIVRRVDSAFCDPLELRPDSRLGSAGLIEAARRGNVSIVNNLGAGVLENPALFPFLPGLAKALLGEELLLPSVPTYWCGRPDDRQFVLDNMARLAIKPISRGVDSPSYFGWDLRRAESDELRARILAEPWAWVGQEALPLSTTPTAGTAGLEARPMVLRSFSVAAGPDPDGFRVMPGGMARVGPSADAWQVSSQAGGISKDVWVLTRHAQLADGTGRPEHQLPEPVRSAISPRVAEDLFWLGRYAERAESIARLLRVTDNRWRDRSLAGDHTIDSCVVVLFDVLRQLTSNWPAYGGGSDDPRPEIGALVTDDQRRGTLAHDIRRVRELAHAVRDQLSLDTWIVLGGLDRELLPLRRAADWDTVDISATLSRLLQALHAFAGLASESMVRDAGWMFLDTGRRLERALQVSGVISAAFRMVQPSEVEHLVIESVLLAADSSITHRRRYAGVTRVETLLELLISDATNPRAVAYQLNALTDDLSALPNSPISLRVQLTTTLHRLQNAEPRRLAASTDGSRAELSALLDVTTRELRAFANALHQEHFAQPAPFQAFDAIAVASS